MSIRFTKPTEGLLPGGTNSGEQARNKNLLDFVENYWT